MRKEFRNMISKHMSEEIRCIIYDRYYKLSGSICLNWSISIGKYISKKVNKKSMTYIC